MTTDPNADLYGFRYAQPKISYTKFFEKFLDPDMSVSLDPDTYYTESSEKKRDRKQRRSRYDTDWFGNMYGDNDYESSKGRPNLGFYSSHLYTYFTIVNETLIC